MLVLLDSAAKLDYYVEVPETAEMLLATMENDQSPITNHQSPITNHQSPIAKPLTLIYPKARHLAPNLIAEDGSIGIRITNEPFSKALCAQLKHPIVSTSANISGEPTPRYFREISEQILDNTDYNCLFRRDDETPHEPSSIIKINADGTFKIIRS